jgi:hypothetical protein
VLSTFEFSLGLLYSHRRLLASKQVWENCHPLNIHGDEATTTIASSLLFCPLFRCLAILLMLPPITNLTLLATITDILAPAAKFEALSLKQLLLRVSTSLAANSVEVIWGVAIMGKSDLELLLRQTTEVAIRKRG